MTSDIPKKRAGDFELPVLGFGTWEMSGRFERDPQNDDERDIKIIQTAIKLGITHIDTAEIYAGGYTETLISKAIQKIDRDKLFITTKVSWEHLKYDEVIRAAKGSLKRLEIDKIDLYLIHGPDSNVSLKETMRAMDYLLENEITRYIGVSNFDVPLIEEAQSHTKYKIVNNQIHYNLLARTYEENNTLEYCHKNNILVTAYRPIEKGEILESENEILDRLTKKYNKTKVQIAINWLINKPNIVTLIKTSNADHLKENLGALGWQLESEDEKDLDQNFPHGETLIFSN